MALFVVLGLFCVLFFWRDEGQMAKQGRTNENEIQVYQSIYLIIWLAMLVLRVLHLFDTSDHTSTAMAGYPMIMPIQVNIRPTILNIRPHLDEEVLEYGTTTTEFRFASR